MQPSKEVRSFFFSSAPPSAAESWKKVENKEFVAHWIIHLCLLGVYLVSVGGKL